MLVSLRCNITLFLKTKPSFQLQPTIYSEKSPKYATLAKSTIFIYAFILLRERFYFQFAKLQQFIIPAKYFLKKNIAEVKNFPLTISTFTNV